MFHQGTTREEPPCLSQDSQSTCDDREEESSAGRGREESSEGREKKNLQGKAGRKHWRESSEVQR